MHPAPSVIVFSSLSGLGFGLLFWLGLGLPSPTYWSGFVFFGIGYALAVGGLISSTFHLGHPERALLAFTQWRSSWLSREAVAAVATLTIMGLFAAGAVFFGAALWPLGWVGAALCVVTVFTTAMIYTQMRTVPRWRHWSTPALYVALSIAGGALLAGQWAAALPLLIVAAVLQGVNWLQGRDALARSGTTIDTATGLGHMGKVRQFEPPHTGTNYLLREFAFQVGRRHARILRIAALMLAYAIPVAAILLPFHPILAAAAVVSHLAGVLVSRWLFFAEAEHVVALYYGRHAA